MDALTGRMAVLPSYRSEKNKGEDTRDIYHIACKIDATALCLAKEESGALRCSRWRHESHQGYKAIWSCQTLSPARKNLGLVASRIALAASGEKPIIFQTSWARYHQPLPQEYRESSPLVYWTIPVSNDNPCMMNSINRIELIEPKRKYIKFHRTGIYWTCPENTMYALLN